MPKIKEAESFDLMDIWPFSCADTTVRPRKNSENAGAQGHGPAGAADKERRASRRWATLALHLWTPHGETQAPTLEVRGRRNVGLLVLKVKEAEGLKKMDMLGKADPFVEAYTQAHQMEKTVRGFLAHGTVS